jgi:integrase
MTKSDGCVDSVVRMKDELKHRQVRVYLNSENQRILSEFAARVGDISESQLMTLLVSAGLRAAKDADFKIALPLVLKANCPDHVPAPGPLARAGPRVRCHQHRVRLPAPVVTAADIAALAAILRETAAGRAPAEPSTTLVELCNEFLLAKTRGGRSERYVRQMRTVFLSFSKGRSRVPVGQITARDIETWMNGQDWAPRTRSGNLSALRILWAWGIRRGLAVQDPTVAVERAAGVAERPILVHTPDEVRQVLTVARQQSLDVMRHLAIRYFCGLRSAEAHRIRETDILHDDGLVLVSAANSKTRSRRLVTIAPNLRAWLSLGGVLRPMSPNTVQGVIRKSGVPWPHNVTRHSFVSYHMAAGLNAGRTAVEAGHSEAVLFRHYRALVTAKQSAEFWSISPENVGVDGQ